MFDFDVKDMLYKKALSITEAILEQEVLPAAIRAADRHHKKVGKMGIVDRVRDGKVQFRKKKSDAKGFKIVNGEIVKMTPEEMRRRKIAGKISARKRRAEMAQILRKRSVSLRVRDARLGV